MRSPSVVRRRAKALRTVLTLPEVLLWRRLKASGGGRGFRRQHPFGPYVLDFFCASARLCVEVDGWAHATGDRPARDARRDDFLQAAGLRVVRIPAPAELEDPDAVADGLRRLAEALAAEVGRPLSQLR